MQVFLVGGAVRDLHLGKEPKDRDYVVVGSNHDEMLAKGYKQVGADFPVYLHPQTGEEHALARTERSTGDGYKDFTTETVGVTLEDDLRRRDLTINAMARGAGQYLGFTIDPFGGMDDLRNRVLRHVDSVGFAEDPLRVVRLARFCAKFPSFEVDAKTLALCSQMVRDGMLNHLTAERVGNEMLKALGEARPARFFMFLHMCGALEVLFPELHVLASVPAGSYKWHPEGDTLTHTMLVLDQATQNTANAHNNSDYRLLVRFCALTHDLGKGVTPKEILPSHHGHERAGVPLVSAMCDRLRLPSEYKSYGKLVAEFHTHVHNVFKLNAKTIVALADSLKPKQHKHVFELLPLVSMCDARGRGPFYDRLEYTNAHVMYYALRATEMNASDVCTPEELQNVNVLKNKLFHARVAAVKKAMEPLK